MSETTIDRERALVTARSLLANVDVLENEGLDAAGQAKVVETAEQLAAGLDSFDGLDDPSVADLARQLREVLLSVDGETARTFVTWLDGILDAGS